MNKDPNEENIDVLFRKIHQVLYATFKEEHPGNIACALSRYLIITIFSAVKRDYVKKFLEHHIDSMRKDLDDLMKDEEIKDAIEDLDT